MTAYLDSKPGEWFTRYGPARPAVSASGGVRGAGE